MGPGYSPWSRLTAPTCASAKCHGRRVERVKEIVTRVKRHVDRTKPHVQASEEVLTRLARLRRRCAVYR